MNKAKAHSNPPNNLSQWSETYWTNFFAPSMVQQPLLTSSTTAGTIQKAVKAETHHNTV
jgi:hypothetical protein